MQTELEGLSELRRGRHSEVFLFGKYAIKVFNRKYLYNFYKEAKFLTLLQPFNFVPKIYFIDFEDLKIVMERVFGEYIVDRFEKEVIDRCLWICYFLDSIGIQKEEMANPRKHILVSNSRVYFIDFERSVIAGNPSNLTQFCSFLMKFGVEIPTEILKSYKRERNYEKFLKIRNSVLSFL